MANVSLTISISASAADGNYFVDEDRVINFSWDPCESINLKNYPPGVMREEEVRYMVEDLERSLVGNKGQLRDILTKLLAKLDAQNGVVSVVAPQMASPEDRLTKIVVAALDQDSIFKMFAMV